jgi:hypothetical protein
MAKPKVKNDDPTMRGERSRDKESGELRKKRSDTHMGTIEKEYGIDTGARADMELGNFLKREGFESLHEYLHEKK